MKCKTVVSIVQSKVASILRVHSIDSPPQDAPTVKELEEALDTPYSTIYKVLRGEARFIMTIEEFPAFYMKFGRPVALLKWIVGQCEPEYKLVRITGHEKQLNGSVADQHENLMIRVGDAIKHNREALKNGRYDENEIDTQIDIYLDVRNEADIAIAELENKRRAHDRRGRTQLETI